MDKSTNLMAKIGKYLRELSIIVTGIAITVGIGLWTNNYTIKKDQKQYLEAIILELQENAENFETYAKRLQKSVRYSNYLRSHDLKSLNQDSIYYYAGNDPDGSIGWGDTNPVILYNEDAFEMFKTSGVIRQIDDKVLLLSIWRVYHQMRKTQNRINDEIQYKSELSMNDFQRIDNGEQVLVPIKWFYGNAVPRVMVQECESIAELIRETISELEKSKMVKR